MTNKLLLCFTFLFVICGSISGQEKEDKRILKADEKYKQYSFRPAIDIYEKVRSEGYVNSDLLTKLGDSYYFNAEYAKAAEVYGELVQGSDSILGADIVFRYAQSLKTIGSYEESDKWMQEFNKIAKKLELNSKAGYNYLDKIEANSDRYEFKEFKYNSAYSDFAPSFYRKGLIFASDRDTGNLARYRHTWNSRDFLDLYKINADSVSTNRVVKIDVLERRLKNNGDDLTGKEEKDDKLPKKKNRINSRFHESTSTLTKDGNTLYFTRNNFIDGKRYEDEEGFTRLKIYSAEWNDGKWVNVVELPFNLEGFSFAHPTLSPDEKFLYFVSDLTGGYGNTDIWKVEIVGDGTFGNPINLGGNINTQARETFPFISDSDLLYFSSDGHPGLGGLDVFTTKIAFDDYSQEVVNLGKPINTEFDDFSYIIDDSTKQGYFASNRPEGLGLDDIYAFVETVPVPIDCIREITGTVRDKISNEVLAGATVKIIDDENNEVSTTLTNSKGEYRLELDCSKNNFVRALKDGYIASEVFLPKSDGKPKTVDFYLERDVVTGGFGDDLAKLLQLSTIYFDLNKYNIRPDAEIEIQKVIAAMERYPSLKIKVNSHTDSQGRDEYNLWLSQQRAQSTVDYMISMGIEKERLVGQGYGETMLINECENGVPCSASKHQLNRRSEFIILE
ncbi:OmpA family protein [Croceivirga thetidis]|uniref:OmpA family protein n=1 Tax=Croceivirga thetidis TaxID=2721623 RepID=A0ABX1GUZ0_9FLAO|nr:OmpA family protein [Croceivirga thetidis]NKI33434.1 OmpA family protein [Croceivirga thetidis]